MAKLSTENTEHDRARMKEEISSGVPVIFPWTTGYKSWWAFIVIASAFTAFLETFQIAFSSGWSPTSGSAILDYIMISVFSIDMIVNFNLAYYDNNSKLVYDRRDISRNYMKFWFWIDLVSVFPFYIVALAIAGKMGAESTMSYQDPLNLLRLFKLARLVRLHRVFSFFSIVKYSRKISFVAYTLMRNFSVAVFWCHLWACIMFFIARQYNFDPDNTWIGSVNSDMSEFERYILSLYWSVVTFSTTGYGDWSPVNSIEQIICIIYLMLNVVIMAWMIGSITLVISKSDNQTGLYRDTLQVLYKYSSLHGFDDKLTRRLKTQLMLGFENNEFSDEQLLHFFPAAVRRKILRRIYMPSLLSTNLMKGTRQQFVDSFLSHCSVEIFSPGEELFQQGFISSDLYLLMDGTVEVAESRENDMLIEDEVIQSSLSFLSDPDENARKTYVVDSDRKSGTFLNELCFFTESPESDTIRTWTACKVLVMNRSHYKDIAADHPGSAGVVLRNLLSKYGDPRKGFSQRKSLAQSILSRRFSWSTDVQGEHDSVAVIRELIEMHISKQKDEHTTWFCFAASRGDIATISAMCDQGFDPNSSDCELRLELYSHVFIILSHVQYRSSFALIADDKRTALMVASMKGNEGVVVKLLGYHANPNLTDVHGNSALFEAVKNNHEDVIDILLEHGAELSMSGSLAAATLCQAVDDEDNLMLKRLVMAKIQVNASDYDKRTAAHIAASEDNVVALKLLVEAGADLSQEDRWGNTARSEAEKAKSAHVLAYLDSLNA
ncbi:LOW QUALITY PROTEIN: hypothetical protein ACHAXA_010111 [Cyclostephanos tholiformis]|uniref:Cyclic nucleotide-binding domain-containing protein n=1 Tax=Cyclostephanos tholiformis TaxID=382380 RepID=A0ABD3RXQ3_9STRA